MASKHRELFVLILLAGAVFSARMPSLSLESLDDAFYARKGVEMARHGSFFTVTSNDRISFQHPPFQFWVLGRSFALFGENDFAARLPSLLMAIGLLLIVYRIGSLTVGAGAGVTGVALLLVTPFFLDNSRRVMMEIPLAFWISLAMLLFLEGLRRPRWHLLLALPLGAAILTKSVLGLLPLFVYFAAAIVSPALRAPLRKPWIWIGIVAGLGLGASWTIHQWVNFGFEAVREHYAGHVLFLAGRKLDLYRTLTAYPIILAGPYQPVILPALVGAFLLIRKWRRERDSLSILLVAWFIVPVVFYSFSGFRTGRYIFPIFPALALSAGYWVNGSLPRLDALFKRWVVPVGLLAGALVLWVAPALIEKDENRDFKVNRGLLQERLPEKEPLTYLGRRYWSRASPLLYYAERSLGEPIASGGEAVQRALGTSSRLLLVDIDRLDAVSPLTPYEVVLRSGRWVLLDLSRRP